MHCCELSTVIFINICLGAALGQRGGGGGRVEIVGVGDYCAPSAAAIGPGGSFQVIPSNVRKVCVPGTSCRNGACNCDNFRDGTVTGFSVDFRGNRSCRRVAGQRCRVDGQCFNGVRCIRGVCTCDRRQRDECVTRKNDVFILV